MTQRRNGTGRDKVIVYVDPDLEDIVPGFLENRRKDADTLEAALQRNDLLLRVALYTMVTNAALDVLLAHFFGLPGIALATSGT